TKPQLEIFNDDVKCSHGATIGQLNDLHIFYLRSRGLDEGQARSMLTYAFANEVVNRISLEPLRDRMSMAILDRMPGGEELKKLV
ncbi:MAG: Fe-S cluster assembly protein SufD, partial [Gammaproteobacteria bacterium]